MAIFAFVMANALFVLIVFLLQLHKADLHIRWPYNAKNTISYDESNNEIRISRVYLELEPIGLMFVFFFGLILLIQFFAMLMHRFTTISQILASTAIDWYCGKNVKEMSVDAEIRQNAVDLAYRLQKPKPIWDEDNLEEEEKTIGRRDTIRKILHQRKNKKDWSNLEANFERSFLRLSKTDIISKNIYI
jgi:chitin synthase